MLFSNIVRLEFNFNHIEKWEKNRVSLEYSHFGKMLSPYSTKLTVGLMRHDKQNKNNRSTYEH